jgi:hypothetical protein
MLDEQRRDGAWVYPNPEWKNRVATAECTWASLGLLATYRHTADERFLSSVLRWHHYLLNEVGFERSGDELAVNYFAKTRMARVPNNSAFVLRFLAELADVTGEKAYMRECAGMLAFMRRAQKPNGEFPYMVKGSIAGGRRWEHFQCYQYNAFQCLDLMRYYKITGNSALRPVLEDCLGFLRTGIAEDGHMFYDCRNRSRQVIYHAAVTGAAFAIAGRLGFCGYETLCDRVFSYLLRRQRPDGSFPYSQGEYYFLRDARSYPRNLSMILFHLVSENACTA